MKNKKIIDFIRTLKYELEDIDIEEKLIEIKYISSPVEKILVKKLKISRSKDGKLELIIESSNEKLNEIFTKYEFKKNPEGFLEDNNLNIRYMDYSRTVDIVFENALNISINAEMEETMNMKYTITLKTAGKFVYEKAPITEDKKIILKEWYTNALKNFKLFSDHFAEEFEFKYESGIERVRIRNCISGKNVIFRLSDFSFKINNEDGEKDISIEYSDENGGIPSEEIRNKIELILSFIMDRQLIKLGETYYKYEDKEEKSTHTLFKAIRYGISSKDFSHLDEVSQVFFGGSYYASTVDYDDDLKALKKSLEKIIENYLRKSDHYKLDNVLYRYLNNKIIPIDYSIPITVTGLEMLANIVSKDNGFKKIIGDEAFENFLNNIKEIPDELLNKIKHLNEVSIGQKLKKIIEVYDLDYNKYKQALRTRNDLNHGSTKVKVSKMVLSNDLLNELVTVIILKILEYDYIIELKNGEIIEVFKSKKD